MVSAIAWYLGWFLGRYAIRPILLWMRRRTRSFEIEITGFERIRNLSSAYLIVSNHLPPQVPFFGSLTRLRIFRPCNPSLDSFIFDRVIREGTGRTLTTVAKCDRGWWSHRPILRVLQKRFGQPFARAQLSALGYIPVEVSPGCFQRKFLSSVEAAIKAGQPILIFPDAGQNAILDPDQPLRPGAAHLARMFGLPIVPAFIQGCESWQPDRTVSLRFGEPIFPEGLTKSETSERIAQEIRRLMRAQATAVESTPVA